MKFNDLCNLASDPQNRIERGHRILKNHRHLAAANRSHVIERKIHDVAPAQPDFATRETHRRFQKPHHGQHRDAFSGPGFADKTQHLVGINVERYAIEQARRALC
jgi:hypothetical protein